MKAMHKLVIFLLSSYSIIITLNCANDKVETPKVNDSTSVVEEATKTETVLENEFEKYPEGFIDSNTFQVVVSSLKEDISTASTEALSVAKKKSLQILLTYPKVNITPDGRKELKEISESGKVVKTSAYTDSRMYFVYQISRPNLEAYVKKQLK
ncbi:MAG: hypothetical protein MH321_09120 [Leptospiraceae bacterium]|nr:hypothetical protein [Leptospiraceae bacterium]